MATKSQGKTSAEIITYYRQSQWLYRWLVYNQETLGMHYGFWYEGTKNRQQSLENENQAVIDYGKITSGQKILDAGCGVGGTAFFISQHTGAHVTGISLDAQQIKLAKEFGNKKGLTALTDFSVQDYCHTT